MLSAWVANLPTSWCQILTERYLLLFCFWNMLKYFKFCLYLIHVAIQTKFCWNSIIHISKLCETKSENCCTFCISYYILSVFVTNQDVSCRIKNGQNMPCNSPLESSFMFNIIFRFTTHQVCFIESEHSCKFRSYLKAVGFCKGCLCSFCDTEGLCWIHWSG